MSLRTADGSWRFDGDARCSVSFAAAGGWETLGRPARNGTRPPVAVPTVNAIAAVTVAVVAKTNFMVVRSSGRGRGRKKPRLSPLYAQRVLDVRLAIARLRQAMARGGYG